MRKILPGVLVAVTTLVIVGGIYLSEKQHFTRIPQAVIQSHLAQALPLTEVYYSSLEIRLERPEVSVPDGGKRINTQLQITLHFLQEDTSSSGSLLISSGIRYMNDKGLFYLTDPKIENLNAGNLDDEQQAKVSSALTMMISGFYAAQPIFALNEKEKHSMENLLIRNVTVDNSNVVVEFGIHS